MRILDLLKNEAHFNTLERNFPKEGFCKNVDEPTDAREYKIKCVSFGSEFL